MSHNSPDNGLDTRFDPKKLYGLIIGIDKYPDRYDCGWWSLRGAVADAKNFQQCLQDLGVPKSNLHLMLNSKRSDIISAFKGLQKGQLRSQERKLRQWIGTWKSITIPKGSAFVLFYAGHGGRTDIPESDEWAAYRSPDKKVEQLVPSNINERKGIQGIPDRTIDAVLKKLAEMIGDNVTVIFDCCHSAGQTRAQTRNTERLRYLPNLPQLDAKCDWDVVDQGTGDVGLSRKTRGGMTKPRGGEKASDSADRSYVLLAACQQDQFACDEGDGGRFTKYLLPILKDTESQSLTYAGIMLRMQMPDTLQTPACYGANQNRIIFTTIEGKPIDDFFIGEIQPRHEHSVDGFIYGGSAHGIRVGDKFKLFDTDPEQTLIGEAEVTTSFAACSTISAQFTLESSRVTFYCRLIRDYSTLTVFNDSFDKELLTKINEQDPLVTFTEASQRAEAMVVITDNEQRPTQVRLSLQHGSSASPANHLNHPFLTSIRAEELSKISKALMATFRLHHILATPKSIPPEWKNIDVSLVEVEQFAQLEGTKQNPDSIPAYWHHRSGMYCHSMNQDGDEASIIVPRHSDYVLEKDKKFYGLSIENCSRNFLFVYVLCLDPGLLRIDPWYSSTYFTPVVPFYQHGEERPRVAAGLKPGETLDIGHGSSGVDPYTFAIDDRLTEEYTYFKIILTTSPADFSMLNQTHNPLEPPPTPDPEMVRSNMARGPNNKYDRPRAVMDAQSRQADAKETMFYFSTTLVVHQCPQD